MNICKYILYVGVVILFLGGFLDGVGVQAASRDIIVRQQVGEDITPPTTSSILSVDPIASTQIDITWSSSTDSGFGLAGYRLYRDTTQIATTTSLSFSDTGLAPGTTYAYSVAAFDIVNNVSTTSAAVSTTTLPAPVQPTVPQATSTNQVGGLVLPQVVNFAVKTGVTTAEVTFTTRTPVQYILRYGITEAMDAGFVRTDVYRREHQTYLTELLSNTQYFYELIGVDRFGRQRELSSGSFVTKAAYTIDVPPNVADFQAEAVGNDVSLRWENPDYPSFAYVRVVRSHYYFPIDPSGGYVVYEGNAESLYDSSAFSEHGEQFYTIFTYNLDGLHSSGAIAAATRQVVRGSTLPARDEEITVEPVEAAIEDTKDPSEPVPAYRLRFSDIVVIQNGEVTAASSETIELSARDLFEVQVPAALVPAETRVVTLSLRNPFNTREVHRYLLRLNDGGRYYTAVINALDQTGEYPVAIRAYDHQINVLGTTRGVFIAREGYVAPKENRFAISLVYIVIIGLIIGLSLWLLWLLLRSFRRKSA